MGCSPWGRTESDTTERLHFHFSLSCIGAIKGGVICISEVIDISPGNLDSSLCFIQSSISHDAYNLNKQGDNIQPLEPVRCSMSGSNFAS